MRKIITLKFLCVCLASFFLIGCSGKDKEDTLQKTVDTGTGKTQVDAYLKLKKQIKAIQQEQNKEAY